MTVWERLGTSDPGFAFSLAGADSMECAGDGLTLVASRPICVCRIEFLTCGVFMRVVGGSTRSRIRLGRVPVR